MYGFNPMAAASGLPFGYCNIVTAMPISLIVGSFYSEYENPVGKVRGVTRQSRPASERMDTL
jgi:hypothetical protein